ncbi:hypothetical protein [Undibacterium sp. TC9W]
MAMPGMAAGATVSATVVADIWLQRYNGGSHRQILELIQEQV